MDSHAEILRLRTALRDLVALSSIPAAWVGREPPAIAAGLADVLVGLLQLDFAFVRLCDPSGAAAVEETRGDAWQAFPEWLQRHLAVVRRLSRKEIIPDLGGADPCRGIVIPIGVNAEGGLVAAACDRTDFPTEIDQLLLSVAANHAATAFQSACLGAGASSSPRRARGEGGGTDSRTAAERGATSAEGTTDLSHTGDFITDGMFRAAMYAGQRKPCASSRSPRPTCGRSSGPTVPSEDAAFVKQSIKRASQDGKDFES